MTTAAAQANEALAACATVNDLFKARVEAMSERVALRHKVDGQWTDLSWRDYYDAASRVGRALLAEGLTRGQPAAILSNTRVEWAFTDLGILGAGGVTVPIYQSNRPEEIAYILENSGARILFLEDMDQWAKCREVLDDLAAVERFVIFDPGDTETARAADHPFDERVVPLADFLARGAEGDLEAYEAAARAATPDDPLTFIYTSGTTGHPKGVVLTHRCAVAECDALQDALPIGEDDVTLAFLPLAHVFARALHFAHLRVGFLTAFAEAIPTVIDDMGAVQPTFFAAVPRIYEKVHAGVMAKIQALGGVKQSLALAALRAAMDKVERAERGEGPGLGNTVKLAALGGVFDKIRRGLVERTGGRIKFFVSGGAPLSREIAVFFKAFGLKIYEGYGLTETTAATHINRPGAWKLGTVGKTVKGVECKIAPDGEILVRGPVIMKEYYRRPEATAEVLDSDGWFHTGDIGEIDAEGFLRITDRKKDIIVTAAGKNVAPQNVENHLKTHPLVSQVAMFGDKRKFCVALITLDEAAARKLLASAGEQVPEDFAEVTRHPIVREATQKAVDEKNADLAPYETIKYFEILPHDFEVGRELTPTLKVKRKKVLELYGDTIEKLFTDHGA
ncbi:MAG: long-chain fatty acid--CoA ligase [Planctomycetota bacterium]|nr:MAG: long-chain fatty acid--CoA ligase [Planctomycetota bacterium]